MFVLLLLLGCRNAATNSFCANKCEEVGGLLSDAEAASGAQWCTCFFPGPK